MKNKFYKGICMLISGLIACGGYMATAAEYCTPSDVKAGQKIVVGGAELMNVGEATVTNLVNGAEKKQTAEYAYNSLSLDIPEEIGDGIYKVKAGSTEFNVNMPEIRWINSDEGLNTSAVGEKIYVSGRNLSFDGLETKLYIKSKTDGTEYYTKPSEIIGSGCIACVIPDNVPLGVCELKVGINELYSDPLEFTLKEKTQWKQTVFDVADYGATADDNTDDTYAVKLALAAADENGGGIVKFPRGKFICGSPLKIPQYVKLKGEGVEKTQICFVTTYYDKGELPDSFLTGSGNFAIEDINFWSMRSRGFLYTDEGSKGNIFIRNIKVAYTKYIGPIEVQNMVYEMMSGGNSKEPGDDFYTDIDGDFGVRGMILYGDNIHIENSYLMFSCDTVKIKNSRGSVVRANYITTGNHRGVSSEVLDGVSDTVWCENQDGGLLRIAAGEGSSDNLYIGKNKLGAKFYGNREALTIENTGNSYEVKASSVNEGYVVLSGAFDTDITGKWIYITDGAGIGQKRKILNYDAKTGETVINAPFSVSPDSTSKLLIKSAVSNQMYEANSFSACGAVKICGTADNISFIRNSLDNSKGIEVIQNRGETSWGLDIRENVFSSCLYSQTVDKLEEGDGMFGGISFKIAGKSLFNNVSANEIKDNGRIVINVSGYLQGSVFAKNKINYADVGFGVAGKNECFGGVILSENILNDVAVPYRLEGTVSAEDLKIN